jgi:hypothetical protein
VRNCRARYASFDPSVLAELRGEWMRWISEREIPWQVYGHLTFTSGRMEASRASRTWERFMNAVGRSLNQRHLQEAARCGIRVLARIPAARDCESRETQEGGSV